MENNDSLEKLFYEITDGRLPLIIGKYTINDFDDYCRYVEMMIEENLNSLINNSLSGLANIRDVNIGEQIYVGHIE